MVSISALSTKYLTKNGFKSNSYGNVFQRLKLLIRNHSWLRKYILIALFECTVMVITVYVEIKL